MPAATCSSTSAVHMMYSYEDIVDRVGLPNRIRIHLVAVLSTAIQLDAVDRLSCKPDSMPFQTHPRRVRSPTIARAMSLFLSCQLRVPGAISVLQHSAVCAAHFVLRWRLIYPFTQPTQPTRGRKQEKCQHFQLWVSHRHIEEKQIPRLC